VKRKDAQANENELVWTRKASTDRDHGGLPDGFQCVAPVERYEHVLIYIAVLFGYDQGVFG
jgi:hypothetical protein